MPTPSPIKLRLLLLSFIVSIAGATSAHATIILGGIAFEDNAFADSIIDSNPSLVVFNASDLASALLDSDPTDGVDIVSGNVLLGFTNNTVINGPGNDLAIFEQGVAPENFFASLTIAGLSIPAQRVVVEVVSTGFLDSTSEPINVGLLDLSTLGVAPGGILTEIALSTDPSDAVIGGADLTAVGALGLAIPEPSTLSVAFVSFFALLRRSRRKSKQA